MHGLVLLLLCTGCGGVIAADDDSGAAAAPVDATADYVVVHWDASVKDVASWDVQLPDGFDAESCYGDSIAVGPCTPDLDQFCEAWAMDRAYGKYGHSVCQDQHCTNGDYCPSNEPCRCSPTLICADGYVCYSDTPDGSTHCKPRCTP